MEGVVTFDLLKRIPFTAILNSTQLFHNGANDRVQKLDRGGLVLNFTLATP